MHKQNPSFSRFFTKPLGDPSKRYNNNMVHRHVRQVFLVIIISFPALLSDSYDPSATLLSRPGPKKVSEYMYCMYLCFFAVRLGVAFPFTLIILSKENELFSNVQFFVFYIARYLVNVFSCLFFFSIIPRAPTITGTFVVLM